MIEDRGCIQRVEFDEGFCERREIQAELYKNNVGKSAKAIWYLCQNFEVCLAVPRVGGANTNVSAFLSLRLSIVPEKIPTLLARCATEAGVVRLSDVRRLLAEIVRVGAIPELDAIGRGEESTELDQQIASRLNLAVLQGHGIFADAVSVRFSTAPDDGRRTVLVRPGTFTMGSPDSERGRGIDEPAHPVHIRREFQLDVSPVTNQAYRQFVLANPDWQKGRLDRTYHDGDYLKHWNGNDYPDGLDDHPVVFVSWYAARAYAEWGGKRLPTEAEWEYACRAGRGTAFWWGPEFDADRAHVDKRSTCEVCDERRRNPWGLCDMLGNVWEWTSSLYRDYPYNGEDGREEPGAEGNRSARGASWNLDPVNVRCARRLARPAEGCYANVGFRCAR